MVQILSMYDKLPNLVYLIITLTCIATTYTGLYTGILGGKDLRTVVAAAITAGLCSGITQVSRA